MSIATIENIDVQGAVIFNETYKSGFGVAADILRSMQALIPNLADNQSLGELNFNAKLNQHPVLVMMGIVEEQPVFTTDFTQYPLGFHEYEGEQVEYALHVADYEGDRYIAFGPLAESEDYTSDKCPEGGLQVQAIPLTEWDEFVETLKAVEIPEA